MNILSLMMLSSFVFSASATTVSLSEKDKDDIANRACCIVDDIPAHVCKNLHKERSDITSLLSDYSCKLIS